MSDRLTGNHLDGIFTETFTDAEGNTEVRLGGEVVAGGLSRAGKIGARLAEEASSPEDLARYKETVDYDDDFAIVVGRMEELIADGQLSAEEERALRTRHDVFNASFDSLRSKMLEEERDAPRVNEIHRLREMLSEEGPNSSARRAIELRLATLYAGGR
jgi:hypothetical protein